ncbi:hypothetical protein HYV82_04835 [Candidatus Woesearchaeota archaeon]|nr:hypothetical protein [Candidatus Woesearchaeota archaeon]
MVKMKVSGITELAVLKGFIEGETILVNPVMPDLSAATSPIGFLEDRINASMSAARTERPGIFTPRGVGAAALRRVGRTDLAARLVYAPAVSYLNGQRRDVKRMGEEGFVFASYLQGASVLPSSVDKFDFVLVPDLVRGASYGNNYWLVKLSPLEAKASRAAFLREHPEKTVITTGCVSEHPFFYQNTNTGLDGSLYFSITNGVWRLPAHIHAYRRDSMFPKALYDLTHSMPGSEPRHAEREEFVRFLEKAKNKGAEVIVLGRTSELTGDLHVEFVGNRRTGEAFYLSVRQTGEPSLIREQRAA